ncbi:MAG: aminopeptidase [Spirochaetia bacterium]|nr:aminopeptidase [Spirochaetia bacterium]
MEDLFTRYADLVCTRQLQLTAGDKLSIHSEEATLSFARDLAKLASGYTRTTVNIVVTEKGRVKEIVPMEPDIPEMLKLDGKTPILCRILSMENQPLFDDEDPFKIAKEAASLSRYNMLGEPLVLDRRVAVPWAVVPVPGMNLLLALEENADSEDPIRLLEILYRLSMENPGTFWDNQKQLLAQRRQQLDSFGSQALFHIQGNDTDFTCRKAKRTCWQGGEITLASGRTFLPSLPCQHLHATLDGSSADGTVTASRPFIVLGKFVRNATFKLEHGRVVSFDAEEGKDALAAFFGADLNANVASTLSLADEGTSESLHLRKGVHPVFTIESTACLTFGAIQTDTLLGQKDMDDLEQDEIKSCLVRLVMPIGTPDMKVTVTEEDGIEHMLMLDGNFEA